MGRLRERTRNRLWPTRRLFEGRQLELAQRLAALSQQSTVLAQQVAELRQLVAATADEQRSRVMALEASQQPLAAVEFELRTRLRRTQALVARTYEAQQRWPELLAAARAQPEYERAYVDPSPLVTVAISTYHSPDTLCNVALESVRRQTHSHWEAIVVGDHCTDDTAERVAALGDDRIRFHNLPVRENDPADPWERWAVKGSVPRATAVAMATGSWLAPLSHDDAWDPDHLETLLASARRERAEVMYSAMRLAAADDSDERELPRCIGAWPPSLGQFGWQSSIFHGALRFLQYDRACAFASEPNDWNLARRAWEAGVRFAFLARETSTYYVRPVYEEMVEELRAAGLPATAMAYP
jgi:hypothetical protein